MHSAGFSNLTQTYYTTFLVAGNMPWVHLVVQEKSRPPSEVAMLCPDTPASHKGQAGNGLYLERINEGD